jgi:hypothetical protein
MTEKAEFNAEEWSTILEGPATAGLIVVTAEKGGSIRETIGIAKAYAAAAQENDGPGLLKEIVSAKPEVDKERYPTADALHTAGMERVQEAVGVLEGKAEPGEVEAYRQFILKVAETAAKAHKEGGFLGIGGTEVSEKEQAALDEIASALGLSKS